MSVAWPIGLNRVFVVVVVVLCCFFLLQIFSDVVWHTGIYRRSTSRPPPPSRVPFSPALSVEFTTDRINEVNGTKARLSDYVLYL